ncbi:phage tail protein [Clostridium butanoliproducens]|uniref:phage tail-collar fiber domain-containing protein n=1 Tax=Clostridium butanoliproducens TaxID=2991837 RepID=UPI0024BAF6A2|nr:phage tail protein [Clostridium butanoliproducens]
MAEQFYTILTSIGKAKIANASVLGTKINLATLAVGDGGGKYYNPTENQETLVNEVWRGNVGAVATDSENSNWIVIETMIAGNVGGFFIREVGVFDDEGNLIAIGKYPETYKPIVSDGATKDLTIRIILEVSNASNVTLKIDPTIIMATKKDIETLDNKIKNIKIPVTKVNNKLGDVTLKAEDIKANNDKTIEENLLEVTSQMADITKQVESIEITAEKTTLNSSKFVSKNVKAGMEELFTSVSNGKEIIATAITGKGVQASGNDTHQQLANKIKQLYGKNDITIPYKISIQTKYSYYGHSDIVRDIAIDKSGYLYSHSDDNTIRKITPTGSMVWNYKISHVATKIRRINVDNDGNVYIFADGSSGDYIPNIYKLNSSGALIWTKKAERYVGDVFIDTKGNFYTATSFYMYKFNSNGDKVSTIELEKFYDGYNYVEALFINSKEEMFIVLDNKMVVKYDKYGKCIWYYQMILDSEVLGPLYSIIESNLDGTIYATYGNQLVVLDNLGKLKINRTFFGGLKVRSIDSNGDIYVINQQYFKDNTKKYYLNKCDKNINILLSYGFSHIETMLQHENDIYISEGSTIKRISLGCLIM